MEIWFFKYLLMCTQMPGAVGKTENIKDRISRRSVLFTWERYKYEIV